MIDLKKYEKNATIAAAAIIGALMAAPIVYKPFYNLSQQAITKKAEKSETLEEVIEKVKVPKKKSMKKTSLSNNNIPDLDNFIDNIVPYMQDTYSSFWKGNLAEESARKWAKPIYKYSKMYDVDPYELTTIAAHETRFKNIEGDINHKTKDGRPNRSSTPFHMLRSTQKLIYNQMKNDGEVGLPDKLPDNLRIFPNLATRMAAYHLKDLVERANGDYELARGMWNGGPNNPNKSYMRKTNEQKRDLMNHVQSHKNY